MKPFTLFPVLLVWSLVLHAQETIQYPYNPDVDNDEYIATSDLTGFLAQFGQDFQPAPVLIDSVDLLSVIQVMQAQITALQTQVASLEASAIPGLNAYLSVDDSAHTVLVSGANLQVVNGLGTDLSQNSLGNVIAGYNTPVNDSELLERTGSHNIIVGIGQRYTGSCNLIGGQDNLASGTLGIVLGSQNDLGGVRNVMIGGANNHASGVINVVVGGVSNDVDGEAGVVLGGESNVVNGNKNVVLGGRLNTASGQLSAITGGIYNSAVSVYGSIVGGESNSIIGTDSTNTYFSAVVGGRFNVIQDGYANSIFGGIGNSCETAPGATDISNMSNRAIFGGAGNWNRAFYATAIFGGHNNVALLRDADDPNYYPVDCIIGKAGRAFVGSTSPSGGQVIDTTFGAGAN